MADAPTGSGSLSDRISKPESTSWADEVASPATENPPPMTSTNGKQPEEASEGNGQVDGATEPFGGSGLQEPEFEVEVKLADMQADPNNPLYSASSFEQLGL
jgi:ATP-dependent RNA helicase DDX19/DBP5